jgi:hypothetical protein
MLVKQCHLNHPPVITMFIGASYVHNSQAWVGRVGTPRISRDQRQIFSGNRKEAMMDLIMVTACYCHSKYPPVPTINTINNINIINI